MEPSIVASASGLSAESAKRRFGFESAVSGADEVLGCDDIDLVVVATRHDSHANLTAQALEAGVPTYVENPLALNWDELARVVEAQRRSGAPLFVGFNRRFAPLSQALALPGGPVLATYRVNAGRVSPGHWTNDLALGGGRLKGEGCHFVDFLCHLVASDPEAVMALGFPSDPELPLAATDNFSLQIRFANGSVGVVNYAADAPVGPGKERIDVSAPGAYGVIDDFRAASVWRGRKERTHGGRHRDKGFRAQYEFVAKVLRGEIDAPSLDDYLISTLATLAGARSLETGSPESIVRAARFQPRRAEDLTLSAESATMPASIRRSSAAIDGLPRRCHGAVTLASALFSAQ